MQSRKYVVRDFIILWSDIANSLHHRGDDFTRANEASQPLLICLGVTTAWFSWGKALCSTLPVDALPDAIDPAKRMASISRALLMGMRNFRAKDQDGLMDYVVCVAGCKRLRISWVTSSRDEVASQLQSTLLSR